MTESERFARSTVDALTAHIAILDEHGTILAVNRAWTQFQADNGPGGRACGVGANYLDVCDRAARQAADGEGAGGGGADEARRAGEGIRAVLGGGREAFYLEYPCHAPAAPAAAATSDSPGRSPEQRWFAMRVTRFAGDGPVRLVVAHENITARKRSEQLERERCGLREAVAGMEQVLGVVGHELRTPLAGMRAISEFLLTEDARRMLEWDLFLRNLHDEVVRMSDTVDALLEAARLNSGRARWNWSHFTLETV
jgi:signal transduction histidine kinase